MKQLKDDQLLTDYLHTYHFEDLFETKDLTFRLYEYEKGEMIHCARDQASFFYFIVSGSIQIYALREDGSHYPICVQDEFTVLGDMEFCGEGPLNFFVETTKKVHCIQLSIQEHEEALRKDTVFLQFLLRSLARKMAVFSHSISSFSSLEQRLLHYFEHECQNHRFKGVDTAATHLRCSRRQLQRLLKDLCEQNVILKIGKGEYELLLTKQKD